MQNGMPPTQTFDGLASIISEQAGILEQYLSRSPSLPRTSLGPDSAHFFPAAMSDHQIQGARESLLAAVRQLEILALGPVEALLQLSSRCHELSAIHVVYTYDVAKAFPLDGEASFADIAKAVNIDEDRITRYIRLCITSGVFRETRPGVVAHTAMSAILAADEGAVDIFGMGMDDEIGAIGHAVEALQKFPTLKNPLLETPFALAHNTDKPYYEWISGDQRRLQRFERAMRANDKGGPYSPEALRNGYDWNALNAQVFVDIGGSLGQSARRIAEGSNIPRLIVQNYSTEEVQLLWRGVQNHQQSTEWFGKN